MKKILLSLCLVSIALMSGYGQNKKAEKEAAAQARFEKAAAAVEAKDFVIIMENYEASPGVYETSFNEGRIFLSYEKEFIFLQGAYLTGDNYPHKLNVSDYSQETDKKGNIRISMQVRGRIITAKVEISLRKGGDNADVIITPSKGNTKRFNGKLQPTVGARYSKLPGEL